MPVEIVMPKLGLTMASGTIARWIKRPGEAVRAGEPLVEVSTDKINYEVESPASGTVARALGGDGEEFACGSVIGLIALAGETDTPSPAALPLPDAPAIAAPVLEAPLVTAAANGARIIASPAARRLARERGIALGALRGTGPRGRITLADVPLRQAQGDNERGHADIENASVTPSVFIGQSSLSRTLADKESRGPLPARLPIERRAIYRKMAEVGTLPLAQVDTVARVDAVRTLIDRRRDFRWTAYAVYAVARLLAGHPVIRTDATTGVPFDAIDIGIAADTPHGLIVPVVRNANALSLAATETEIVRLATRARDGTLTANEIGNACFSISNVGPQGIDRVSPLPDPPQTAILGLGAATQRPAIIDGSITPAWMMTCTLTFDHRFIDGAPAAKFLAAFANALANPGALL